MSIEISDPQTVIDNLEQAQRLILSSHPRSKADIRRIMQANELIKNEKLKLVHDKAILCKEPLELCVHK